MRLLEILIWCSPIDCIASGSHWVHNTNGSNVLYPLDKNNHEVCVNLLRWLHFFDVHDMPIVKVDKSSIMKYEIFYNPR